MRETPPLPVIIEPFSTFGDEVVGDTLDELARNLLAAVKVSRAWRCKPRRPCPEVRTIFQGHRASPQAQKDLREVAEIFDRCKPKPEPATVEPKLAQETLF